MDNSPDNKELDLTKSLTQDIAKNIAKMAESIANMGSSIENLNGLLKENNSLASSDYKILQSTNSIYSKISHELSDIQSGKVKISKFDSDTTRILEKQLDLVKESNVQGKVGLVKKLTEQIKISKDLEKQKDRSDTILKVTKKISGSFGEIGKVIEGVGSIIEEALISPYGIVLALIGESIKLFVEFDKSGEKLSKNTGLLRSQTVELRNEIRDLSIKYSSIGVTSEKIVEAMTDIAESTNGNLDAMEKTSGFVSVMAENFGISAKDSADVLSIFRGISGLSNDSAVNLEAQTTELARQSGVAPAKIMADIAKSSSKISVFMRGNSKELVKTAIAARKFGVSMDSVSGSMESLLDFEGSINKEMELSQLLGKNINLQGLRQAAYNGDGVDLLKQQNDFLQSIGGLQGKNYFQVKAISEALGMSVQDLQKMNEQQVLAKGLDSELSKAKSDHNSAEIKRLSDLIKFRDDQNKALTKGNDILKETVKTASHVTEEQMKQKEIQGNITNLQNSFNSLVMNLGSTLLPTITSTLIPIIQIISEFTPILIKIIKHIVPIISVFNLWGTAINQSINLIDLFSNKFIRIGNMVENISSFFINTFDFIGMYSSKLIPTFIKIFNAIFKIGGIISEWISPISKIFGFIGKWLGPIGIIINAFQFIGSFWERFKSSWEEFHNSPLSFSSVGKLLLNGIISVIGALYDVLIKPFIDAWNWLSKKFLGNSPSELGLRIVDGIESVGGMLFDVLTSPFKFIWDFIGKLFGISNLGSTILDSFKSLGGMIIDLFINVFKSVGDNIIMSIKNIIPTLFGILSSTLKDFESIVPNILLPKNIKNVSDNGNNNVQQLQTPINQPQQSTQQVMQQSDSNKDLVSAINKLMQMLDGGININMDGEKVTNIITQRVSNRNA